MSFLQPVRHSHHSTPRVLAIALVALALGACSEEVTSSEREPAFHAGGVTGAVFTQTNAAAGNSVVAFSRDATGVLTAANTYATGGLGTGAGLGSQGAVTLSDNGRWLLVVNAGSDQLSLFAVQGVVLTLSDVVASGGDRPVSVAIHNDLVYVLNAGSDNIGAFRLRNGQLTPAGTALLTGTNTGAAQVSFNPRGDRVVVTQRATNRIELFAVGANGELTSVDYEAAAGATPFGFGFSGNGSIVVSEANGGAALGGLVSSYAVNDVALTTITGALAIGETAPCWVVVTNDHRYAFVANAGTRTISTLVIGNDGTLTLVHGAAGSTGAAGPLDMALSRDGRFVYAVTPGSGLVHGFAINHDGSLTSLGSAGALPTSSYGLAGM